MIGTVQVNQTGVDAEATIVNIKERKKTHKSHIVYVATQQPSSGICSKINKLGHHNPVGVPVPL